MTKKQKAILDKYAAGEGIAAVVAKDALDYEIGYLKDIGEHGCISGACGGLISYKDTYAFYNEHADECDEVLHDYEENTGEAFKFNGRDVRNTMAWIGYEAVARKILEEIEEAK